MTSSTTPCELQRRYASRSARTAHLVEDIGHLVINQTAVCGHRPTTAHGLWLGGSDPGQQNRAAGLPLCPACRRVADHGQLTRRYWPSGRSSHLVDADGQALCGGPSMAAWPGLKSDRERRHAVQLPLCPACRAALESPLT